MLPSVARLWICKPATNRLRSSIVVSWKRIKAPRPSSANSGTASSNARRLAIVMRGRSSEAHNRPDAEFELLHQSSIQDHETAADSDRATRPSANFGFNQDWQPFRLGPYREPGTQELFQSSAEAEREADEAIVQSGHVRGADAARQKRPETFDFGDDELTREVRVKLVQRDVSERRAKRYEWRVEPQRRRRPRPTELNQGELIETDTGRQTIARGVFPAGLSLRRLLRPQIEGPAKPDADQRRHLERVDLDILRARGCRERQQRQ